MYSKYLTSVAVVCLSLLMVTALVAEDWTRFRGPNGAGVHATSTAPLEWSETKNLKWSVELPGLGSSCPIVVGDKIFLTSYTGYGIDKENPGDVADLKRHMLCFDRSNGKELWRTTVVSTNDEDPYQGFIRDHGYASGTPVSDGEHVFVFFGKSGVVAFDMEGNQKWMTPLGTKSDPAKWGGGASPVLHKDLVIVNAGIEGHKIVALNKADGKEVWSVENAEFTNCWSTPISIKHDMRQELVFSMPGKILALNPDDGKELWSAKSPIARTVCGSLAYENGVVFAMGGRQGSAVAIKCGGEGDVSETHTVWSSSLRSGIGTPVIHDSKMYWTSGGVGYCADCKTGEYVYKDRIKAEKKPSGQNRRGPAGDYASPVIVNGKVVMMTRSGTTFVVNPGDKLNKVGENSFASDTSLFNATPAITDSEIFIRSEKKLYCVAKVETN